MLKGTKLELRDKNWHARHMKKKKRRERIASIHKGKSGTRKRETYNKIVRQINKQKNARWYQGLWWRLRFRFYKAKIMRIYANVRKKILIKIASKI